MAYSPNKDWEIKYAEDRILADYGDVVSVENKAKGLLKFGRNPSVGSATTGYTIWNNGQDEENETYVAANTNSIDTISSTSASDTMEFTVEGHTESGGNKTSVTQTVTLTGTTKATLTTPLNRVNRAYNSSGTNLVGDVYIYEDTAISGGKPTDTTKIHARIAMEKNQTEKAATALSSVDYWIITGFRGSIVEKAAANADIELQIRLPGGVFRPREEVTASNAHNGVFLFKPYLIVPPNSDIRLVAVADGANTDISGSIQGYLANIQ